MKYDHDLVTIQHVVMVRSPVSETGSLTINGIPLFLTCTLRQYTLTDNIINNSSRGLLPCATLKPQ